VTSGIKTEKRAGERYRRSPALVLYWAEGRIVCFNPASAVRLPVPADAVAVLDVLDNWSSPAELVEQHPSLGAIEHVIDLLSTLADLGLLQRESAAKAEWPWAQWSPEAAFLHFGTRDARYEGDPLEYDDRLRVKAIASPPPPPTKRVDGVRRTLPPPRDGPLADTLRCRRTWRRFAEEPLDIDALGSLLQLTFGVQKHARVPGQGPIVLKTSPSGGARHPLEAYVIAQNVSGLSPGAYHYDAASHELVDLARPVSSEQFQRALADQYYYAPASAIVVMTAVVSRKMWRYPYSRAYRSILIEAGHFGQTFCLLATAFDLAPFCTMAFRDSELESLIGVDGVNESALYVVGAGTRPRGPVDNPGRIPRSGGGD
jgi:SagB-type dehydrogenase family enzyme